MPPYFDARHLPQPRNEYVAWIDVMGTQAGMSRSLATTANFMFKLHSAAIQAPLGGVRLYPVMDGLYVTTEGQAAMRAFLTSVFEAVAAEFNHEDEPLYRFLVRGAIAFGPTIYGAEVPREASASLAAHPPYLNSILLGLAMVQAHLGEPSAPPLGVFVHDTARSFSPAPERPFRFSWWRWSCTDAPLWIETARKVQEHLEWCEKHSLWIDYRSERIKLHREMAAQYFSGDFRT